MQAEYERNRSLKPFTTFRIGGKAKLMTTVYSAEALCAAVCEADAPLVLGRGSNVLISDDGYDGTVILNRADKLVRVGARVRCDSGMTLSRLSRYYAENGLTGLEWACGIPGTLGGALVTNAGAFGGCMADVVEQAEVLRDGKTLRLTPDELGLGYRSSALTPRDTVLSVTLGAERGDRDEIAHRTEACVLRRKQTQPHGFSAGSVFCAAAGKSAGWYIDNAGLKGLCVGDACVSEKHANFIVNRGFASAKDVRQLIDRVRAEVYLRYGIKLKQEIRTVGDV